MNNIRASSKRQQQRQEGLNPNKFVKTINKIHAGQSKNNKKKKKQQINEVNRKRNETKTQN